MQVSRRVLLTGIAPGALLTVAGCTTAQQASITAAYNQFLAQVQAIVAKGCSIGQGFIPAIPSIEAVINILYPGLGTAVAGVAGAINAVSSALCSAATTTPPASLARRLRASSPATPIYIGTIVVNGPNGPAQVQVNGYK